MKPKTSIITSFIFIIMLTFGHTPVTAQQKERKVRIAKIEIYPAYLEQYKAALAEHAKTEKKEQ